MSRCFGVKIILQDSASPVSEDTAIGLYNVAASNSEFRWCQNSISGLSTTWCSGMIIANGLSRFTLDIDLRNGGNTSHPGRGEVTVNNLNKFWQTVQSKNVVFNGLKLEIWELGTGDHQERIRTYFCKEPSWNNKKFTIPFIGGQEARISNILNVITSIQYEHAGPDTINKTVPATFGKLIPEYSESEERLTRQTLAQLARTYDRILYKKYNDDYFCNSGYTNTYIFPISQIVTTRTYSFDTRGTTVGEEIIYPDNLFVKIVFGTGSGQVRKLYELDWVNGADHCNFIVQDFFETELLDEDSGDGRSWVQIIEVNRRYDSDHFPNKGFYNKDDQQLTNGMEMYTHDTDDGFSRTAPYGYEFENVSDANNKARIDPIFFDQGDLDTQNSFLIIPVENVSVADDADLGNWDNDEDASGYWSDYEKHGTYDGIYGLLGATFPDSISNYSVNGINTWPIDKQRATAGSFLFDGALSGSASCGYWKVVYFDLPKLPENFSFDSLYIGIRSTLTCGAGDSTAGPAYNRMMFRRFKWGVKIMSFGAMDETTEAVLDDIPDFYCVDSPDTNNQNFFKVVEDNDNKTGYTNTIFATSITTKEEYESYIQGGLFLTRFFDTNPGSFDDDTFIYELCLIFKKSSDIKTAIYSPMYGRIFNDTWGGRKIATDVMAHPIDVLEHLCRLQNYRDTCSVPISGWGLQYSDTPLIATVDYGGFDDSDLITDRQFEVGAQIFDLTDGYTDVLKKKLCNDIVIANWQDDDGYERVIALPDSKIEPVYTVQMTDVMDRSKIEVLSIPEERIIAEPWVNYNRNPATGEYESSIFIKNTSASAFSINYVSGIHDPGTAEYIWNMCHSLALKTHKINKPGTDKTDLTFANGPGAYTIALNYLENWVKWQFHDEIEFNLHYNTAASWQECTPFNILFSHQTNDISRCALVESINVNPNPPYDMMLRAIMYLQ